MSFNITDFTIKIKNTELITKLNLCVEKGEILVIQGVSGCGKSTLLKCIAGFVKINNNRINNRKWFQEDDDVNCIGSILLNGFDITDKDPRERQLGYLIQNSKIYPHLKSPKEVLEFTYKINKRIRNKYPIKKDFEIKAKEVFDSLDFHISYDENISNLSGGEEQRLLLAKYLLLEPKLLLLDEPFSNLDYFQREKIREIIKNKIADVNNGIEYVLMVSHDINDGKIADKILYFKKNSNYNNKFEYQIINNNTFETAFDVFSRLYGDWKDQNNNKVKDNIITKIIKTSTNKELITDLFKNFLDTFNVSNSKKNIILNDTLNEQYHSDLTLEKEIKKVIYPLNQILYNQSLIDRASIIFNEIKPFLNSNDNIIDVGCGDGRVSNLIKNNLNKNIALTDIYKHSNLSNYSLDFKQMENSVSLPYSDNKFNISLLLTVLHHSDNPYGLLKETKRITKKRIIIIESVLGINKNNAGKFNKYKNKRIEYARLIDWLYNRIVYDDDVNVPYNFLCVDDWKNMFRSMNLKIIEEIDLGIDIKVVPEHHYLFVLEKE